MAITDTLFMPADSTTFNDYAMNYALSSAAHKVMCAYRARSIAAITHVGVSVYAKFGTAPNYRISIQGISSNVPDGIVKGGASPASVVVDFSMINTLTYTWFELDNPWTPAIGEVFCVVIEYSSGTIDNGNRADFYYRTSSSVDNNFPYSGFRNNGVWALSVRGYAMICAKDTNGVIAGGIPAANIGSSNVDTDHIHGRAASVYTPDRNVMAAGAFVWALSDKFKLTLRDSDDNICNSGKCSITMDASQAESGTYHGHPIFFEPYELTGGGEYKFCFEGVDATDANIYYHSFTNAEDFRFIRGSLKGSVYNSFTSTWSPPNEAIGYMIFPYITGEDQSGGGGGGEGIILGSGSG